MSVTFQDIATELGNSFTKGTQTQEGILQNIVNFFVTTFAEGIIKLMVIIIPIIVLFKILDFLMEFIRQPNRSVKTLVSVSVQTILHYAIVLFLAEFWVKYFYQDMFILITEKLPMQLLNLSEPMSLDKMTRVFTAPFIVYGNILNENSQEVVKLIQKGASQEEINNLIYTQSYWGAIKNSLKAVTGLITTTLSFLSDTLLDFLGVNKTGNFLVRGFAFVGVWILGLKIMKLIATVVFAYLFAGLSIAISLAMGTFHFIFTSEKTRGLGGGLTRLLNIIINSITKFTVLILFIQVANNDKIPLTPIWTARQIAKIQDDKTWTKNINNPQTFYYIFGYWIFMLLFAKVFKETTETVSIT